VGFPSISSKRGAATGSPEEPVATGSVWLAEPRRPEWVRERPNAHYFVLAAVCVGAFMGQLDASIVTVAFPTLRRTFDASLGAVTWVGLSYLIVLVAGVTAVGRLADMVGRKLLYTYGFLVFIAGSALCGLAPTLLWLDVFRVLQGVGAAMLQANSVAIIYLALPRHRLGRGIGIQGAAQALGLALGPAIGGLLLAAGGWRLIFFVNVPAGLLGVAAAWIFIPRSRELQDRVPYDWRGLALFVPMIAASLVVISFGNTWGWLSPAVVMLVAIAGSAGVTFVVHEGRTAHPMMDRALFARRSFSVGLSSGLLSYLLLFGTMFAVPFFLEIARGRSAGQAGLALTVLPVALGCTAPFAGRLAERVGPRPLTGTGMMLSAAGLAYLGVTQPTGAGFVLALAVVGTGLGLFTPPNNAAVMASAPRDQAGQASGILNMTRGFGTALGLALTSLVLGAGSHHLLSANAVADGFEVACLFLSGVGLVAALLAIIRHEVRNGQPNENERWGAERQEATA
jgi:EmrB/QacA subfamily drug resistance transporter